MKHDEKSMDEIIAFAKQKGFVYPSSELYDGFSGAYDYGPRGVELARAIKSMWWSQMVDQHREIYGLDSTIVSHPEVWVASGHVGGFSDPLADCKVCQQRIRVDKELEKVGVFADEKMSEQEINKLFDENREKIACPNCGSQDFSAARAFNMLVTSNLGDFTTNGSEPAYLRGETAQGIFINFKNVVDSMHPKIPFGIAQIGKAFRNEISPRQFLFRTREFEQMEMQYFVKPGEDTAHYESWKEQRMNALLAMGLSVENLRWHQHENLVFYAQDAWDIEYNYPDYGYGELEGIHARGDYDLSQHAKHSGKDIIFNDNGEKFVPHVVETSIGVGRLFLALLSDAYDKEIIEDGDERTVLRFTPTVAPTQVAIMPLMKKDGLSEIGQDLFDQISRYARVSYDESGSIGKRYRRADEVGTPLCVTIDYDTKEDHTVTVRDRDSMEQVRIHIDSLEEYIKDCIQ